MNFVFDIVTLAGGLFVGMLVLLETGRRLACGGLRGTPRPRGRGSGGGRGHLCPDGPADRFHVFGRCLPDSIHDGTWWSRRPTLSARHTCGSTCCRQVHNRLCGRVFGNT